MSKTTYVFSVSVSSKRETENFVCDDLRRGMDGAVKVCEDACLGLGKSVGQGLRPLLEGGAALKQDVPHASSGKTSTHSASVSIVARKVL